MPTPSEIAMQDKVPVPHFKERLWQELAELHRERHEAATSTSPTVVDLDDHPRRRGWRGRRSVLIGAGSIAAAALLVVTQLGLSGGDEPAPSEVDLTDRVLAATEQALQDSIMHTVTDYEGGEADSEGWYDETTLAGRSVSTTPEGEPVSDVGSATPPAPGDRAPELPTTEGEDVCVPGPCMPEDPSDQPVEQVRFVCHSARVYGHYEAPVARSVDEADAIREMLEADWLVEDGTEVVDGKELIRLKYAPTRDVTLDVVYLVDPDSYRPVMQIGRGSEILTDDGSVLRDDSRYVMRFEYLPRTAENLALLSPPVPDGFTELSSEELQQVDCG